jgi:pSer/pThr/pTyr-binding forkhead associated (FHA) protein
VVAEPLLACIQRFLQDPKTFESRLNGRSVLLYEPVEAPGSDGEAPASEDSYAFRTVSGVGEAQIGGGDPTVSYLEKTRDNAFVRRITLGRTSNNDVIIDSPSVSRFHAWFQQEEGGGGWNVVDAGSKNGTELNGKRLPAKRPQPLTNGAQVKVGQIVLGYYTAKGLIALLKERGGRG